MTSTELSTDLWARIEETIAQYDLLKHPFYQAWSKGELTREQLAFYGAQYGEHVSAFPTYLTRLHSRLPEGSARKAILANAAEEEIDGRSHADLWRQFANGMGEQPVKGEVLDEVRDLVETFKAIGERAALPEALGAFYAYESQVPRVAQEKLAGLTKFYGADARTGEYFSLHITADVQHSATWRNLIDKCVQQDPACAEQVLAGVEQAAKSLWKALDGIEQARTGMISV
ncbi:MAG TPA: iron-containing redox enzyme family protein [Acidobacteriaceae bacterium]|jgi:pyrroloquinoline-quinone synthase